jgi:hypothetical protein
MNVTITLTEDLATELTRRASRERRAPEVYASQLLGDALQQLGQAESWEDRNQHRLRLICKGMTEQLEAAERAELEELQAELDRRLEASDDQLLDVLERMQEEVRRLPDPAQLAEP